MYKHNKKRNIGLISEFFSRYMAAAFVDGRHADIEKANAVWRKYINPKTEAYREYVLFNALHETSLKDRNVAHSLLEKVKSEVKKQSQDRLDKEKNSLINEINSALKDPEFFGRSVEDYRDMASIQLLMNAWRGIGFKGSLSELATLEESVLDSMLKTKVQVTDAAADFSSEDVDGLVVRFMTEKFNRKYGSSLNKEQSDIVRLFAFSSKDNDAKESLVRLLETIRKTTLEVLDSRTLKESIGVPLSKKLLEIKEMLSTGGKYGNVQDLSEDTISFYMTVSKLKEEMESSE